MGKHFGLMISFILVVTACSTNAGTVSLTVRETAAEITEVTEETIHMNNCGGSRDSEQTAEKSKTVQVEISGSLGLDLDVLKREVAAKYSEVTGVSKSLKLSAAPGTNMEFNLRWTEKTWIGVVTAQGKDGQGNYRVGVPISVELVSSKDLGCASDESPLSMSGLLLNHDFQDGIVPGFVNYGASTWHVVSEDGTSNKVLEGNSAGNTQASDLTVGSENWRNYITEFRFRFINYDSTGESLSGLVTFMFRHESKFVYVLALNAINSSAELDLGSAEEWLSISNGTSFNTFRFETGTWYTVRVEANGSQISVSIDNKPVIDIQDTRVKQGAISFGVYPNMIVQFDDLRVTSIE